MPEKRRQAKSANRTLRKTRVVWSKLDCFKSNPDRDKCSPAAMLTQRGVTVCRAFPLTVADVQAQRPPPETPGRLQQSLTNHLNRPTAQRGGGSLQRSFK